MCACIETGGHARQMRAVREGQAGEGARTGVGAVWLGGLAERRGRFGELNWGPAGPVVCGDRRQRGVSVLQHGGERRPVNGASHAGAGLASVQQKGKIEKKRGGSDRKGWGADERVGSMRVLVGGAGRRSEPAAAMGRVPGAAPAASPPLASVDARTCGRAGRGPRACHLSGCGRPGRAAQTAAPRQSRPAAWWFPAPAPPARQTRSASASGRCCSSGWPPRWRLHHEGTGGRGEGEAMRRPAWADERGQAGGHAGAGQTWRGKGRGRESRSPTRLQGRTQHTDTKGQHASGRAGSTAGNPKRRPLTNHAGVSPHGRHRAQHKHEDVRGGRQLGGQGQGGHDHKERVRLRVCGAGAGGEEGDLGLGMAATGVCSKDCTPGLSSGRRAGTACQTSCRMYSAAEHVPTCRQTQPPRQTQHRGKHRKK